MINYFRRRYALSEEGARDLFKGMISHSLFNISAIFPIALAFFFVQRQLNNEAPGTILYYVLASVLIFLIIFFFAFIDYRVVFTKIYTESAKRRILLAEKLKQLPLSFFDKKDVADLSATIMSDATEIESLFSHAVPQLYAAIVNAALLFLMLLFFNWKMALAAIWVIPFAFLVFRLSKRKREKGAHSLYAKKRVISDDIQEGLDNAQELFAYNREDHYVKGLLNRLDDYEQTMLKSETLVGSVVNLAQALLKLGLPSVALYGAYEILTGGIDLFTYLVFLVIATKIYDPIMEIILHFAALNMVDVRVNRMKEMDALPIQEGSTSFTPQGYDIVFDDVSFSYQEGIETLKHVSFTAKQGEVTALVGPSGGGKTTVTKLAGRFWDVSSGRILVGGVDISTIEPETLLKDYAIVFQNVALFNASVMENIRLGKKGASDEEVRRAAKAAQCDEFVAKLPEGYDTLIGENGERLSGGERQRISIARAILKDAPIILLDEATASVDVENESKIQAALSRLIEDKTVLIIAHRMRTIAGADHVVVLSEGQIVESGSPSALEKENGLFASMLAKQKQTAGALPPLDNGATSS